MLHQKMSNEQTIFITNSETRGGSSLYYVLENGTIRCSGSNDDNREATTFIRPYMIGYISKEKKGTINPVPSLGLYPIEEKFKNSLELADIKGKRVHEGSQITEIISYEELMDPSFVPKTWRGIEDNGTDWSIARREVIDAYEHVKSNNFKFSSESHPVNLDATLLFPSTVLDQFLKENTKLDFQPDPFKSSLVDCLNELSMQYDKEKITISEAIAWCEVIGHALNTLGENLDLGPFNPFVEKNYLNQKGQVDLKSEALDIANKTLIKNALLAERPHVVIALFELGVPVNENYLCMSEKNQINILRQTILEDNRELLNYLLSIRKNDPENFSITLALEEMIKHPSNNNCKNMLTYLLLSGKNIPAAEYKKLERNLESLSFLTQTPHPFKEILKDNILHALIKKINENKGKILASKKDEGLLAMLDNALNPKNKGKNGCYDILNRMSYFSTHLAHPHQQILHALHQNEIVIHSDMQSKFPFLVNYYAKSVAPLFNKH